MSPQFADLNGDGIADILVGTYDGTPHASFGAAVGFGAPTDLLTKSGKRIYSGTFWNYDKSQWDSTESSPNGYNAESPHVTSAVSVDWDADGDLDLLLGDYHHGKVFLRRNVGDAKTPTYAEANEALNEGKFVVAGGVSTIRIVDWNGDGLFDLMIRSMGDCWGEDTGGGVDIYLNSGKKGAPAFGEPTTLIARSPKHWEKIARPDCGLYVDPGDFDGDGDIDLVVGGYSIWRPPHRAASDADKKRIGEIDAELSKVRERSAALNRVVSEATKDLKGQARTTKLGEITLKQSAERTKVADELAALQRERDAIEPPQKREAYVWLYENRMK